MTAQGSDMRVTRFVPDADNTRQLRDAFGKFSTGVTIITCPGSDGPIAITANSFSSISLTPPLVLWAIDRMSRRFVHFDGTPHYAVHVLHAHQKDLATLCARDMDGLAQAPHRLNDNGVPLIDGCLARFECTWTAQHSVGDHDLIIGEIARAEYMTGAPLTFYQGEMS